VSKRKPRRTANRKPLEAGPSVPDQTPHPARLLTHALAAMGDERWDEAITALQHFLEIENLPANRAGAHQNLSACYLALERFDEALAELDQVAQFAPNNPDVVHSQGVVYACAGRAAEAIETFELFARRWPQQARRLETRHTLHHLARIQSGEIPAGDYLVNHLQEQMSHNMDLRDWHVVERKARRMIAANPNRPEGHFALGVACTELGHHQEALDALLVADSCDPDYQPTLYNIGRTCLQLDDPAQALSWLERSLRHEPAHLATLYQLGEACERLGRRDEAVTWWQQALKLDPHFDLVQKRLYQVGQGPEPVEPPLPPNMQKLRAMSPIVKARMRRPQVYRTGGVTLTFDGQVGYVLEDADNQLNGTVHAGGPFRIAHLTDNDAMDLIGVTKLLLKMMNVENTRDVAVLAYYADRPIFHYQARFSRRERVEFDSHNQFVVTEVPRFFKLRADSDLVTPYGDVMRGTLIYLNQHPQPGILVNTLGLEPRSPLPGSRRR
jgi:tetratricopeptide (TPR) repeat protein